MRSLLVLIVVSCGCTATPAPIPDDSGPAPVQEMPRLFAELEQKVPFILDLTAPPDLFELRDIRLPDSVGTCELETLATDPTAENALGNYNHSYVETYDQRNCPVYQSATRSDEKGQLTLTVDGMYGEWRRTMWSSEARIGQSGGYTSEKWVDTPMAELKDEAQPLQEFDDQGRLIKETSTYDGVRHVSAYDYDAQGRVLAVWQDSGSGLRRTEAYGYGDYGVELVQYFEGQGRLARETRYLYDEAGMLRVTTMRSILVTTGFPAYTREEYDETGNPISSTTDQDGDGNVDAEWRQEFSDTGMTYRRDRYTYSGVEYVTEWSGTYDSQGRLTRSQSTQKNNGKIERLELTIGRIDQDGNWRNARLTKDQGGIYGDMDVSNDDHFLFSCQLDLKQEKPVCSSITAQLYDKDNNPTQYCTQGEGLNSCQRYIYGKSGYVLTELMDEDNDGIADRRSEYRYDADYTLRLIAYLTPSRWAQIKESTPPAMTSPEIDD